MVIAVNNLKDIEKLKGHEIIYAFKDEKLKDLLKTGLHCVREDTIEKVDINLTNYDIKCKKKTTIDDENLFDIPPVKQNNFAIIIPNYNNDHGEYNGKTYLQNCIESVLSQTYKNFKLIIVDDMSTDTSVETVKSYKDKRIHLIQNKRKRYNGGSRNVGIEYALDNLDFDYFAFLDSDDWWKHDKVLETINEELEDCELMLIGLECINKKGVFLTKLNEYDNYQDFFLSDNKVWCTAWARIIRKDKIVYFPESTLMEDRNWSYLQADNVDFNKVKNLKEVCYVWNRLNTSNSVSLVRNDMWNASAYCHIGHQIMLLDKLKHKEMIPVIKNRIEICKSKVKNNIFEQY